MGIVGIIIGGGLAVVGSIVSGGISIWQMNKAEARMKAAEKKAEKQAAMAGRRSVINAMRAAAAGSTALRIDKSIAENKLNWMKATDGKSHYVIASEASKKIMEEKNGYNNGNPEES